MTEKNEKTVSAPVAILAILALVGAGALVNRNGDFNRNWQKEPLSVFGEISPEARTLLIRFGDLGPRMVSSGVIDEEKFLSVYEGRDNLKKEAQKLLGGENNGDFVVTGENAPIVLNFLWALGLGNKNQVLEQGSMMDPRYGGAGNFASTGGWTLAVGSAMDHYSMHSLIALTPEEQALVEKVSKNIYRPCCDNSAYFPDCNHGMAMLGFLELLASQGTGEEEMYKAALALNMYWFPSTYDTIAQYMKEKGIEWKNVPPKEILGINYSSASGFQNISLQIKDRGQNGGSSCSV
jgi:hypothetical protein